MRVALPLRAEPVAERPNWTIPRLRGDIEAREDVQISRSKRSSDFLAHLEHLDRLYGPRPGQPVKPVVLVEDNGPIHTSTRSLAALANRAHGLPVEWLPKYAPELNDIERVWHDLKANHPAHQTFADPDGLEAAIHQAVEARNQQRGSLPSNRLRISA